MVYRGGRIEVEPGGVYLSARSDDLDVYTGQTLDNLSLVQMGVQAGFLGPLDCIPGGGLIKDCACVLMLAGLLYSCKRMGMFDVCLDPRNYNCRRLPCACVRRKMLESGYDDFDDFQVLVTVVAASGAFSKRSIKSASYYAKVSFWYEVFKTKNSPDGRFMSTASLDVPQGADKCKIQLYQTGVMSDTLIGELVLDTKKKILENPKAREKHQKYTLLKHRAPTCDLEVRFRVCQVGDEDEEPLLEGLDEMASPHLYEAVLDVLGEDSEERNITGQRKMEVLAQVCCGEGGKKAKLGYDSRWFAVASMPVPGAAAASRSPKWLFCWWKDKSSWKKKPAAPEGFLKLIKVTKVYCGKRADEWVIEYRDGAEKGKLQMRAKRRADVWIDAFSMAMHDAKDAKKEENKLKDLEGDAAGKSDWASKSPVQKWAHWEDFYRKKGLSTGELLAKKQEFLVQQGVAIGGAGGGVGAVAQDSAGGLPLARAPGKQAPRK